MAVQFQLETVKTDSNIPNFSTTNTSGTVGVVWKY
jgi:hypothetical protein